MENRRRDPLLSVTDAPSPVVSEVIGRGLARFNEERPGIRDFRPLAVVARDPTAGTCWAD